MSEDEKKLYKLLGSLSGIPEHAAELVREVEEAADEDKITLIRADAGPRVGPVIVITETRDKSVEAINELIGASGAVLLSCARTIAEAAEMPVEQVLVIIVSGTVRMMAQMQEAEEEAADESIH